MQLVTVDLGNTNPHFAIFENDQLQSVLELKQLESINIGPKVPLITSSVRSTQEELLKNYSFVEIPRISKMAFLDMPVQYSSSLGEDRLVQSFYLFKNTNYEKVCLIDIGTFITIDFVSSSSGYLGGYIFPGINTFLASYKNGARLPLVDRSQILWEEKSELPHNTYEAIADATKIYLESILSQFQETPIVLTGGDTELAKSCLNTNELTIEKHLIHHSLFYIFKQLNP